MPPYRRAGAAALVGAATAVGVGRLPEPSIGQWRRTNFRGRTVSLSGGLAAAAGAITAAGTSRSLGPPALIAAGSAFVAGAYDDLVAPRGETSADKGFRGHLAALRAGRVSGGLVKIGIVGAGALAASALLERGRGPGRLIDIGVGAGLIAGTANLVNLLDLRPGRALKVTTMASVAAMGAGADPTIAAGVLGASLAGIAGDLAERTMLGDLGANPLGALLGLELATGARRTRWLTLGVVAALTAASERVSFSAVIDKTPALRRLDALGRAR